MYCGVYIVCIGEVVAILGGGGGTDIIELAVYGAIWCFLIAGSVMTKDKVLKAGLWIVTGAFSVVFGITIMGNTLGVPLEDVLGFGILAIGLLGAILSFTELM